MADRTYGRNFGRVPDELLWDQSVSDRACRLYAALTRYGQQRDRIVPPRPELAARLGWSLDKLDRVIAELEKAGALHVERRPGVKGESRTRESVYWLDGLRPDPSRNSAASPSRGSAANDSRNSAATSKERDLPDASHQGAPSEANAQTTLRSWLDRSGLQLTQRNRDRFGKGIKDLLSAGESETDIAAGLDLWAARLREGAKITPGHLPDFVDQARNRREAKEEARREADRARTAASRPRQDDPAPFAPDPSVLWGALGMRPPPGIVAARNGGGESRTVPE